jgi:hypothetical protein
MQRQAGPRYHARADGAAAWRATGAGLGTRFTTDKVRVETTAGTAGRGGSVPAAWHLRLSRFGCGDDLAPVAAATPTATGNRVEYDRTGAGHTLREWYLNGPLGLEQGFTIAHRPTCGPGDGRLRLELDSSGDLVPSRVADGNALDLRDTRGEVRLRYTDLHATDATGRTLPARLELDGGRVTLAVDATGAAWPVTVDPLIATQQAKLVPSDGAGDDRFGSSVAVAGDTAVVGAPHHNIHGVAYVYTRGGGLWTEQQKLEKFPAPFMGGVFGTAVSVDSVTTDTLVVGAPYYNDSKGAAYLYTRSGITWSVSATLTASDGLASDSFGGAVALVGDTVVVGAPGAYGDTDGGAAYVFWFNGTGWVQQQKLTASTPVALDQFGASVALSGSTAVVGAPHCYAGEYGAAYVFVKSGSTWSQQQQLVPSDPQAAGCFGRAVALDGDTAVVTAVGPTVKAAYVFVRSGSTWTQQQKLVPASGTSGSSFGASVALRSDFVAVGDPYFDTSKGVAFTFRRAGTSWYQEGSAVPTGAPGGAQSAVSLALSGDTLVSGALYAETAGVAYVFLLGLPVGDSCALDLDCQSRHCVGGVCCPTTATCGDPNGSACPPATCASGNCVDGYCCDKPCVGECASCAGATLGWAGARNGICAAAPTANAGDPSCSPYACNGTNLTCQIPCLSDADCGPPLYCATNGTCQSPKALAATCTDCKHAPCRNCQSGLFCVDGYCCSEACNAACRSCALTPGTCLPLANADDPPACESAAHTCSAAAECKLKNGQWSSNPATCASGFAADGYCCSAACSGGCDVCAQSLGAPVDGTCTVLANGSTGSPSCSPYVCSGAGTCPDSCTSDTQCATGFYCDATGHCVGQKALRAACDTAASADCKAAGCRVCASGQCRDGFCCDLPCADPCDVCAAALGASQDGTCSTAPPGYAGDPMCAEYACTGASTGCTGTMCAGDAQCIPTHYCDPQNHCVPRKAQGDTCNAAAGGDCLQAGCRVCTTGFCADGRCCADACTTTCLSCGNAAGTCTTFVAQGTEDIGCTGNQACDGAGGCKLDNGETCGSDGACVFGHCADSVCCNTACGTDCYSCNLSASRGTCAPVARDQTDGACTGTQACDGSGGCKKVLGTACGLGEECLSGNCVDGVCCATTCTETCYACRADLKASNADSGQCGLARAGVDPHNNCAAEAQYGCGQDGQCNGSGACRLWGYGTSCDAATVCDGNTVRGKICDGSGTCVDNPSGVDCGLYVCRSGGCVNPCNAESDCVTNTWCNAGVCTAKQAAGTACTEARQCLLGFCVDGFCCDTLCDGLCQACAAALKTSGAGDGACGHAKAGSDPRNQCPDDGAQSCDRNGVCDGAGQCALYQAGAPCQPAACANNAATTYVCDGAGACNGTAVECAPFACASGACVATCTGDDDCADEAFCDGATCVTRWDDGTPCTEGRTCAKGWCIDGVCCATACTGQCEACDLTGLEGTCAPVNGDPRNGRDPCPAATGSDPCTARACRGGTDPTQCVGWAGVDVECRVASCVDGLETRRSTCDGSGHCPIPDTKECQPYVCQGLACGAEPCAGDTDCAADFRCDPATHKCVARDAASCDGEHTVTAPNGVDTTDCSPYRCEVGSTGGQCKVHCTATTDCVAGYVCDTLQGQGVCVTAGDDPGNQGGGCAAAGAARTGGPLALVLLLVLGWGRRGPRGRSR